MKKVVLGLMFCLAVGVAQAQKEKGFGMGAEVGFGVGASTADYSMFQFHLSPGYHFNKFLFAGAGVGVNYHYNNRTWINAISNGNSFVAIPLFAHATLTLPTRGRWLPFLNLKLGYSFFDRSYEVHTHEYGKEDNAMQKERVNEKGQLYITPAIGVKCKLDGGYALSVAVAYESQYRKKNATYIDSPWSALSTGTTEAITVRMGVHF